MERLGVPYMITGATAAILYGQPRLTNDLDVVIERKLEYFREGGSDKHLTDIRAIRAISSDQIDRQALRSWIEHKGLSTEWQQASA